MRIMLMIAISFYCSVGFASERPNVLIILADDLGYSDLGCYGGEIPTPNIDSLASGGVKFSQMYTSARCCPTRASLMTGLYPSQAGIGDFTTNRPSPNRGPGYIGRLNDECVTIAEALKPSGYNCYYVGKWHMHEQTGPIKRGFDEFYGYTRGHSHDQYDADYYIRLPREREKEIDPLADEFYATDVFNEYALEFIRQGQQKDEPWFLFLGHSSPHFPVQAPAERADKYFEQYLRGWDVLRDERYERMQSNGLIDGARWELSPRSIVPVDRDDIANGYSGQPNPAWNELDEDRRRDLARRMAVFAAMVEGVDRGVGQILDHLKQTDDLDNTLILFLSDNGACYEWGPFGFDGTSRKGTTTLRTGDQLRETGQRGTHQSYGSGWANLGNTPFRQYKHFTTEGGLSSPFIAHWPNGFAASDSWVREPSHVMDVMPTVLEATGAAYPNNMQDRKRTPLEGTSLLPAMRGESASPRTIGFDHQAAHAWRDGDWKIVWSKRMPHEIEWELYNLAEDRCEMHNLAEQQPDRVLSMSQAWETWARRVGVIWESESSSKPEMTSSSRKVVEDSPTIANSKLVITASIDSNSPAGVVLAQGGNQHGYALHFVDGRPTFDVRVRGQVQRVQSKKKVAGRVSLKATIDEDSYSLQVNDGDVLTTKSLGLIPAQPQDSLSIAFDDRSAAGNYSSPNDFRGTVNFYDVQTFPIAVKTLKAERPNFIFMITDDISPKDLSVYGNTFVETPNLEKLAKRGLVFDNAYLTISSCSPSRCSIITGRYPHNTGAPELHTSLPTTQRTFVQELKQAGYHTVISGKNHMGKPDELGFDLSSGGKPSGAEKWVDHLRNMPEDQPFFCWFAFHDAHFAFTINDLAPKFQPDEIEVPQMLFDGPGTREMLTGYYHEVCRTDHYVGEMMKELKRQGKHENTYLIYCADNGRPFPRCKTYLYDSGIKTPLLIAGPGVATGRTDSLVSSIDFSATILELAGVDCPKTIQGQSAVPILNDPTATIRDVAFAERNWHVYQTHERAVRSGDWLYIENAYPELHNVSGESAWYSFAAVKELWEAADRGELTPAQALLTKAPQPKELLFKVTSDPFQFENLADEDRYQAVKADLQSLLNEWRTETGDSIPTNPSPDRQSLHDGVKNKNFKHGEFAGAINNAESINRPGPIRTPKLSPAGSENQ